MTSIFLSFIGTIVNHPGVQERAYMEILDVVGSEELPCLHHRDNLPYIECIIKEVHRCYPAIPMITRSNDKEDIYEGLRIPQKSWVIGNVWAILHDEKTYDKPDEFVPQRFEDTPDVKSAPDPRELVYGFGRRRCPGAQLADFYLFLIVARVLAVYKIVPLTPNDRPHLEFTASFAMSVQSIDALSQVFNDCICSGTQNPSNVSLLCGRIGLTCCHKNCASSEIF
ncbi:hypothetical protein H2248_011819 [Termitomyces sp. 'cryptogamus']|nr:hypothetical protein H2248_011819 [Termitomyces sp. 'cryptogamus']